MDSAVRNLEKALQRAGNDIVILDRTLVLELKKWIMMFAGNVFFYEAYCHFCKQIVSKDPLGPKHLKTCTGIKFLEEVKEV